MGLGLNKALLKDFIGGYEINEDEQMIFNKGLIETHASDHISLYLTDKLSNASFLKLLKKASDKGIYLSFNTFNEANYPKALYEQYIEFKTSTQDPVSKNKKRKPGGSSTLSSSSKIIICHSVDHEVSIEALSYTLKAPLKEGALIIDVSEMDHSQLIYKETGAYDTRENRFFSTKEEGLILKAFKTHSTLILKGTFKPELQEKLIKYLYAFLKEGTDKKIILLKSNEDAFSYISENYVHSIELAPETMIDYKKSSLPII